MSFFKTMTTDGLEQAKDSLGGSFGAIDTDAYQATIKLAYALESSGGAMGVFLLFELANGREYRETVYVTSGTAKGKNNFYIKDGKKEPMPGFTIVNDLCMLTLEQPLSEINIEEKTVNIYDYDAKKELPKSVPVLIDLLGKTVYLAVQKNLEDKTAKDGNGVYQPTGDTKETNNIAAVFHDPSMLTLREAVDGKQEATFAPAWIDRNKGKTRDRVSKDAQTGTAGGRRPTQVAGGAPVAAGGGAARKPLFGK